jgi:hypothetical protein
VTKTTECESVIETAYRIQDRRFDLLGYRGLSFGDRSIEWQRDPVHGIRAPKGAWFRIPYLDFTQIGDHKIVWELSRHQHLTLLARAWLYTGNGQFLHTLQNLWAEWREANPYPTGVNWASTLEVAFRCLSWIWIDQLAVEAAILPESFYSNLRQGIGECAVYIQRYVSTYFAPNTHLIGEALALFFVGVLYPEFEPARFWREHGWKLLLQESSRQVRADGFHFEQSVYYHVYALDMFLHARLLASRNEIAIPASYDQTLSMMAEGLAAIGAGGQAPRFGDDDGGRLFDGRRNRSEHMLDPLPTAAIIYGRGDWKSTCGELREETIWLCGSAGARTFDQLLAAPQALRSRAFAASGYYVIASANALAVVDGGPHGWGNAGHGHADALSIQLIAHGRAWLTDPGTGAYPSEKPERDRLRGTAAHNTLEVDGRSQAEPLHSFAWRSSPATTVHLWYSGPGITLFRGSHNGYGQRLEQPVVHERWVIGWYDDLWMVLDRACGRGKHRLDLRWHLLPDSDVVRADSAGLWRAIAGHEKLEIIVPPENAWDGVCETGSWSPAYGKLMPAPVLHFSCEGLLPKDSATILSLAQPRHVCFHSGNAEGANVYLCTTNGAHRLVVLATKPGEMAFRDDGGQRRVGCNRVFGECDRFCGQLWRLGP